MAWWKGQRGTGERGASWRILNGNGGRRDIIFGGAIEYPHFRRFLQLYCMPGDVSVLPTSYRMPVELFSLPFFSPVRTVNLLL
jgi:hypothetical protein